MPKRNLVLIVIMVIVGCAAGLKPAQIFAQNQPAQITEGSSNQNTNVSASAETVTVAPKKKFDFRPKPALMPLLLIPLAVLFYFIYTKLAQRD